MTETLPINLREVLYRTRGLDWDYAFLLQPDPILAEGWYALHRRMFSNVEPGPTPLLLRGELGIGTGHPFFATAFTDAARTDYQGRPVAHYLAWLGKSAEAAPGWSYGPGLIDALGSALDAVFNLAPAALKQGQTKPLDVLLRQRFLATVPGPQLLVPCTESDRVHWLGTISC
jgi:hypothetical protein